MIKHNNDRIKVRVRARALAVRSAILDAPVDHVLTRETREQAHLPTAKMERNAPVCGRRLTKQEWRDFIGLGK